MPNEQDKSGQLEGNARSKSEMPNEQDKSGQPEGNASSDSEDEFAEEDTEHDFQGDFDYLFREMVIKLSECLEELHVHQLSFYWYITLKPDEKKGVLFLNLMREAEARRIVTCNDFSRLLKGLSALTSCAVVDKAVSIVASTKDLLDGVEAMPKKGPQPEHVGHWKKFGEWYEYIKITRGENSTGPNMATAEEIIQYLESMYPHFRVNTIKKHFHSIEKYVNLSECDKEQVEKVLKELSEKQTYLFKQLKKKRSKSSRQGQQKEE